MSPFYSTDAAHRVRLAHEIDRLRAVLATIADFECSCLDSVYLGAVLEVEMKASCPSCLALDALEAPPLTPAGRLPQRHFGDLTLEAIPRKPPGA